MPMGFTTEEFLGGADAVQTVVDTRAAYQQASSDLWYKIVGTAKQIVPKALSSAQAAMAQLSYSGSTGNFLSTDENIVLTAKFLRAVDMYPEKIGNPLYSQVYLNTLSGFVQCRNAVFGSTTATVEEENAVEEFLNSGFYYE